MTPVDCQSPMNSACSRSCDECKWVSDSDDQWCEMFRAAPAEVPCAQHDLFSPARDAMAKTGLSKLIIAVSAISG